MRNTVPPSSAQSSYSLDREIELRFPLTGFIEGHSIRLHGDISIELGGAVIGSAVDNNAGGAWLSSIGGAHTLIDAVSVEVNGSRIEQENLYQWLATGQLAVTENSRDVVRCAKSQLELRSGRYSALAVNQAVGCAGVTSTLLSTQQTFSVQPLCGLTKLPFIDATSKQVVLIIRLASARTFLVNRSGSAGAVTLANLFVSFQSWSPPAAAALMKATPALAALPFLTCWTLPQAVRSGLENVSLNVTMPGPCLGWYASFVDNATLSAQTSDSFAMLQLPGLSRVRFLLDGTDMAVKFPYQLCPITADPLMLMELAEDAISTLGHSVKGGGINGARDRDNTGAAFVIGQKYDPPIMLAGSSVLSVEIQSDVTSAAPWTAYFTFITAVQS